MSGRELVRLDLADPAAIVGLRHVSRRAGRALGLTDNDTTRLTTAVSELGRVAHAHLPATAHFVVHTERTPDARPAALAVDVRFADAAQIVLADADVHRALVRLMDEVQLGTDSVAVAKALPGPVDEASWVRTHDALVTELAADVWGQLPSVQNELVSTLAELRDRETALIGLNAELDETNRGVVALYSELERNAAAIRTAQRAVFEELEAALRPPPPQVQGIEFGVRYRPAQANSPTGGDLYDWFLLPDGALHVTVVDVKGHGVEGTRDALHVTHAVRTLVLEGHPIDQVLARADRILQSGSRPVVATAQVMQLHPMSGRVRVAGAGHPPALLVPRAAPARYLEARGRALGYDDAGSRELAETVLGPGDGVLLYTDGLTEVRRDVVEGMETLRTAATESADRSLGVLLDETVRRCLRRDTLSDDTLLLAARWTHDGGSHRG